VRGEGAKKLDFKMRCSIITTSPKHKRDFRNEGESKKQAKKGKATLLMIFKGRLNGKNYKEFAEMQIGG